MTVRRTTGAVAAMLALSLLLIIPAACSSADTEFPPATQARSGQPTIGPPTSQVPATAQAPNTTQVPNTAQVPSTTEVPNTAEVPTLTAGGPGAPWWGLTVDTIDHLDQTIAAIAALPVRPVVRLVFDLDQDPASYSDAITQLSEHATVMAQVVDSSGFASISGSQYLDRFRSYVAEFGDRIPLWEIGNEVNGEWLGDPAAVVTAITGADQIVRANGLTSVLTLYYNPECANDAAHDMINWIEQHLTPSFRNTLPVVLLSYYPDQCNGYWPDTAAWERTFSTVGTLFPQARVGIGEVGISDDSGPADAKADLVNRCYGLRVPVDRYLGGCFWWYFAEDAVPHNGNQIWAALAAKMTPTDK